MNFKYFPMDHQICDFELDQRQHELFCLEFNFRHQLLWHLFFFYGQGAQRLKHQVFALKKYIFLYDPPHENSSYQFNQMYSFRFGFLTYNICCSRSCNLNAGIHRQFRWIISNEDTRQVCSLDINSKHEGTKKTNEASSDRPYFPPTEFSGTWRISPTKLFSSKSTPQVFKAYHSSQLLNSTYTKWPIISSKYPSVLSFLLLIEGRLDFHTHYF